MTTSPVLGSHKIMAFLATRGRVRAQAFYGDTPGLRFVSDDSYALVFDANGIMLRISPVPEWTPPRHTVLGWEVPDIVATVEALEKGGVKLQRYSFMQQRERGIQTFPGGARVAWFQDPDGNTLSGTQF
jgi:catechol 2,3-dioxygenase-like lactoylglutathione lyase family enzyme